MLPAGARLLILLSSLSALLSLSFSTQPEDCISTEIRPRSFVLLFTCNSTTLKDKQKEEISAPTLLLYVPLLYLASFTLGLPANLLALWVLLFRTKKLPSTVLLINLTLFDLLLLLVLPFRVLYHFQGNDWSFGEPFCRVVTALFYGNMYGSVLSLALVAFDRYVALVHPFGAKTLRSRRTSACMSTAVWVVALAAMLPLLMTQQSYKLDDPPITTCHDALPEDEQDHFFFPYFSTLFTVCFLLPLLLILFCYTAVIRTLLAEGQRYSHAVRVTVLVLLVFLVCLLPSNILLLLHYSDSYLIEDEEDLYVPYMVSLTLSTFNSCIDPFIFYYVSEDFRDKVRRLVCCRDADGDSSSSSAGNQVTYSSSSAKSRSKVTLLSKWSQDGRLSVEAGRA